MRAALLLLLAIGCGKGGDKAPTASDDKATNASDKAATGSAPAPAATAPADSVADKANVDAAGLAIQKLAYEAYPLWAAQHPDKDCPSALADLQAAGVEANDPWGHPYELLCGPSLPKGVHGIGVRSLGPDGKPDTADDVTSWQR